MAIEIRPASAFEDVRAMLGPKRAARGERAGDYHGEEVAGWAAVAPRADTTIARNRRIPHVDDLPVWAAPSAG